MLLADGEMLTVACPWLKDDESELRRTGLQKAKAGEPHQMPMRSLVNLSYCEISTRLGCQIQI